MRLQLVYDSQLLGGKLKQGVDFFCCNPCSSGTLLQFIYSVGLMSELQAEEDHLRAFSAPVNIDMHNQKYGG